MTQEFIPYEQALALKALGFDEMCFGFYDGIDKSFEDTNCRNSGGWLDKNSCAAPLKQQAFRWFREKHGIRSCIIDDHETPGYNFTTGPGQYYYDTGSINGWFQTYEEAELACLIKLIEIVKEKK